MVLTNPPNKSVPAARTSTEHESAAPVSRDPCKPGKNARKKGPCFCRRRILWGPNPAYSLKKGQLYLRATGRHPILCHANQRIRRKTSLRKRWNPHGEKTTLRVINYFNFSLRPSGASLNLTPTLVDVRVISTPFWFLMDEAPTPAPTAMPASAAVYVPEKSESFLRL